MIGPSGFMQARLNAPQAPQACFIEVVNIDSGEVVDSVDVTRHSDRAIEKIERGMLRNMDRDNYFTRVVERAP